MMAATQNIQDEPKEPLNQKSNKNSYKNNQGSKILDQPRVILALIRASSWNEILISFSGLDLPA